MSKMINENNKFKIPFCLFCFLLFNGKLNLSLYNTGKYDLVTSELDMADYMSDRNIDLSNKELIAAERKKFRWLY